MQKISCATIWGGIRDENVDVCSSGLDASLYSSSAEGGKGGDIYYLSVCGDDALTRVTLADVAGHGPAVSDVSQWLYDCLEQQMGSLEGDRILHDLNRVAVDRGIRAMTTGVVVSFYLEDSHLYFAYAGHHPMLIQRGNERDWQPVELDDAGGNANLPLGVVPDATYSQRCTPLTSGDRLFLYTDGLTEAPRSDGERFGEDRLRAVLRDEAHTDLPSLKQSVLDAALDFSGGRFEHDDVTLIALQVR
jgi:sigma-B regulation protein RsbU (phosphoserine phosphatase)